MNVIKTFIFALLLALNITAQTQPVDIVSEDDSVAGVVKALPDFDKMKDKAEHITKTDELKKAFRNESVLDLIDFTGGNEAATADYPVGKLLIVEFASPQVSFDTDAKITERLNQSPVSNLFYRRIGNYNVFLFNAKDEKSANELLGKIKYEKSIKWLGEDPFYYNRAERHFVENTTQLFLSTILALGILAATMVGLGIAAGFIYFRFNNKNRKQTEAFSDAGGMTRLNLDELTGESPDRLLND